MPKVLTKFSSLQRRVPSQHLCQTEPGEQFPCGMEKEPRWQRAVPPCIPLRGVGVCSLPWLCCSLSLPPHCFPHSCPGQAHFPALPLRSVCALSGTAVSSGSAGWVPAPDKHISFKILLHSLAHSLSWSLCAPFLLGSEAGAGMLCVNQHKPRAHGVPEWKKP